MEFHARVDVFLRAFRVCADEDQQLFGQHFAVRLGALFLLRILLQGGGGPRGAGVDGRVVLALVQHGELDAVVGRVRHRDGLAGQGDLGADGLGLEAGFAFGGRCQIGDEDATPDGGADAGKNVTDVKHRRVVGELFLEDLRDHVRCDLRGGGFVEEFVLGAQGQGIEPDSARAGDQHRERREGENGRRDDAGGDAARAHRDQFVVARHASQTHEDADQDSERNAQQQDGRQGEDAEFEEDRDVAGPNQKFHQRREELQEDDKCRERGREKGADEDLPEDVARKDFHRLLSAGRPGHFLQLSAAGAHLAAESGEGATGSLGSSSSILVSSRSSISREGATTETAAELEPRPSRAKGALFSR